MKVLSQFILSFILLTVSFSCGQKGKTTNANVTLVAGFAGTIPGQTGGTMILGYSPTLGQSFSKVFDGSPMELPNGAWDFAAISWDGNTVGDIMQGQTRCSVSRGNFLNGGNTNVNLALSSGGCADPLFGSDDTKAANGEPLPILPTTCTDREGVRDDQPGSCKNSVTSSYRVTFPGKGLNGAPRPGLISGCVSEDTPTTPELDSASENIKLPIVLPGPWEFPIVLDLYDGAGCTGALDRLVVFNAYTGEANRGTAQLNEQGSYAGTKNELKVSKNPCSSPVGLAATPFSPESGLYALCTADQIDTFVEANLTDNYELYSDIDFTGINFTDTSVVQGTFEGLFDGRGRSISNVTISNSGGGPAALFRQIDGTGNFNNDEATIKNLNLSNFNITTNAPSNGALVGNVLSGSQVSRVSASNITITITAGADGTGGLIGKMLANGSAANSANTNDWSSVRGIQVNNVTIINNSAQTAVGGILGILEGNTSLENSLAKNIVLRASGASARIGGAIGNAASGAQVRAIRASVVDLGTSSNPLNASVSSVGGLIGRIEEADIFDSKAEFVSIHGGNEKIGGLIGEALGGTIDNVVGDVNIVQIPSGSSIGGLIGRASNSAAPQDITITQARSYGSISCSGLSCGGLIGTLYTDSAATTTVAGSYSEANVTSTNNNVGGLIGQANNNASTITINESAAFGNVSGATDVGGLVGRANGVTFTNSYAQTNVTGTGITNGGFVGNMIGGSFTRCYSDPTLAASNANYEPFVNGFTSTPGVTDVFYVHPDVDSNIGAGGQLTIAESQTAGNFTNFDFTAATGQWTSDSIEAPNLKAISSFQNLGGFETGSNTDPIILTSPTQWNAIGDKPQLMNKVYRLGNTLDFQMGTFVPIGSVANPFVGSLQGNNQTIMNINFVDSEANAPVGLFRKIGVDPYNSPTKIEHENPFDYDEDFSLIIRNVSISKASAQIGAAGILAGVVEDDGTQNPMNGMYHDYNMAVKISGIEVYDSFVDGGKSASGSQVGGLIGFFSHTNGQSEIESIKMNNTQVYSGVQNGGTGGVIGRVFGPLNANSTPALRRFETFILDGLTVQASGTNADYVGGVIGFLGAATANWELMVVSNTNVSGYARVGGMFGDVGFGNYLNQGSFVGGSVSGQTLVGGIAGNVGNSTVEGMFSKTTVASVGTGAGCIAGQGSGGTNITVENSVATCPAVTSGGAGSYFVAIGLNAGPTTNSVYVAPGGDEGLDNNAVFLSSNDILNPAITGANLITGDPWILNPGFEPLPYWFIFPEALENR